MNLDETYRLESYLISLADVLTRNLKLDFESF
jgi:hypothetical protein